MTEEFTPEWIKQFGASIDNWPWSKQATNYPKDLRQLYDVSDEMSPQHIRWRYLMPAALCGETSGWHEWRERHS